MHGHHRAAAVRNRPEPVGLQRSKPSAEGALDPRRAMIPTQGGRRLPGTTGSAVRSPSIHERPIATTGSGALHRPIPQGKWILGLAVLGLLTLLTVLLWVGLRALPAGSNTPTRVPAPASQNAPL